MDLSRPDSPVDMFEGGVSLKTFTQHSWDVSIFACFMTMPFHHQKVGKILVSQKVLLFPSNNQL